MPDTITTVPAQIEKVETRADRSVKIVLGTSTELDPLEMTLLFDMNQKLGWFGFAERALVQEDLVNLPDIPAPESPKSPAQRLRGALYRLWEQQGKHGDFEVYYNTAMERLINQVKEKLV